MAEAVTINAARIVGWSEFVGRIAPGFAADVLALRTRTEDAYENLALSTESDVLMVAIDGVPRYGDAALMRQAQLPAAKLEKCTVTGRPRLLYLDHPDAPPEMNALSLEKATAELVAGMSNLNRPPEEMRFKALGFEEDRLELELEMDLEPGSKLLAADAKGFTTAATPRQAPPDSVPLDGLTVPDDAAFFTRLERVAHAPAFLSELRTFY